MSEKQEQQNTERSRMLGTMEMRKLVPTVSVPIMVSMLVQALYNIVDGIFVGQYSPDALTAVNLAMPMQMLMIAVSTGMGTGINSLISRRLGEKRSHEARDAARHGILIDDLGLVGEIVDTLSAGAHDHHAQEHNGSQSQAESTLQVSHWIFLLFILTKVAVF